MLQRLRQLGRALVDDEASLAGEASPWPRLQRIARFWVMVGQNFVRNRCPIRASALAYSTLLSLVPLLAVVAGILTGVLKSDQNRIRSYINQLLENIVPQLMLNQDFAATKDTVMEKILEWIGNVHSGILGTTGTITLLVIILFMLARVEETFNDIWGVARGRSWYARMVNYWAAISLGPVVVFTAIGFTTILRIEQIKVWLAHMPFLSWLAGLAPVPILCGACALFYALMPNTKVQWKAAFVGGLTAGILWHLNNTLGVVLVSGAVSRDQKIFAGFAVLPVFMVGLYFFWMLLLFGAQVAYTYQNRASYLAARQVDRVHQEGREFVALRVMIEVARAFARGTNAPTNAALAEVVEVPSALVGQILRVLQKARLIIEVNQGDTGFAPARPLEAICVADVLQAMRRAVGSRPATRADAQRVVAEAELARVNEAERRAGERSLAELIAESVK